MGKKNLMYRRIQKNLNMKEINTFTGYQKDTNSSTR